ncbi:efflux RND transporter periplasmic adaptor subunit [Candidatus Gracilibacteria bacterium]|nr:efflux RND transporter periplasmic adaptor subunit [Candidatus Gracilibacteria bacterium]
MNLKKYLFSLQKKPRNLVKLVKKVFTWKNAEILAVVLLVAVILPRIFSGAEEITMVPEEKIKVSEVIEFGSWVPSHAREILATIQSSGDIDILSEVAGTIDKTFVKIGDEVEQGELLASFRKTDDTTQVNYDNALRTLGTTKMSAENAIRSAEIALQTAERTLKQTRLQEDQEYNQAFEKLRTIARNSETNASNALDWADLVFGISPSFRNEYDADRSELGKTNKVKKQETRNLTEDLLRERDKLPTMPPRLLEADYLLFAQSRLDFLQKVNVIIRNLDGLIRKTPLDGSFSLSDRDGFITTVEAFTSDIDAAILALENQLQTAKTQGQSRELTILTAENSVETAKSALELAQSTASANIASAQNTLNSAHTTQQDLEIRAPFSGKITAKEVSWYDQVKVGDKLFSLVSGVQTPKIVAYVTADELDRISSKGYVDIKLSKGTILTVKNVNMSSKTDTDTQKIKVEFPLDEFPEDVMIGGFVKVLLPAKNGSIFLLPISALSFEPDGAEVLILNKEGIAERRKITYGKIVGDAVEVKDGLQEGDQIIKYRTHVHAGEKIMINK